MNDNEVAVRIVGDASGVAPATNIARDEVINLKGAIAEMSASMKAATEAMVASLHNVEEGLKRTNHETKKVHEEGSAGLRGMAHSTEEALAPLNNMRKALGEIAEVVIVAFAIERIHQWAEKVADAAEQTAQLAESLGMTTQQIQLLGAISKTTNIPLENLTKGLGMMDRNLATAARGNKQLAATFKDFGVALDDGKTQMQKFQAIADKFSTMEEGPKKAALAMQVFGRAGIQLIPVLNMGSEGLAKLTEEAQKFDVAYTATSDRAQQRGLALADSLDVGALAMQGITNVLTDAFAPALTAASDTFNELIAWLVKSYNEGGVVATVFTTVSETLEITGQIISALAEIIKTRLELGIEVLGELASAIMDVFGLQLPEGAKSADYWLAVFKNSITVCKDVAIIAMAGIAHGVETLIATIKLFAMIAKDAFTLNWGAIEGDWQAGMAHIQAIAIRTGKRIKDAMTEAAMASMAAANGKTLKGDGGGELPKLHGGGSNFDPAIHGAGAGKTKKAADDRVAQWKQSLSDMLLEEQNWGKDDTQISLAFWQQKLAHEKLSEKQRLEIQREINRLRLAMFKANQAEEIANIKQRESLAEESAKTEIALAKIVLQEKLDALDEEAAAGRLTATQLAAQRAALNRELYQLDVQQEERVYQLKVKALQDELALAHTSQARKADINRKLELMERQHLDRLAVMNRQNNQKMSADNQKVVDAQRAMYQKVFQPFASNIAKMLTLQQSFAATMGNIWNNMVSVIEQAISQMVVKWLISLTTKEAASKSFHMKEVLHSAKQAAAGAWSAVVKIPFIGPVLAPIAAATAFAGVMAFSAERGMGEVPFDNAPFLLHKKEMVLPADMAQGLRGMISGGGSSTKSGGAAANGGGFGGKSSDFHFHDYSGNMTPEQIHANRGALARAIKTAHREGHFTGFRFAR